MCCCSAVCCCHLCFPLHDSSSAEHRPPPAHLLDGARCLRERGLAFAPAFGKEFATAYIKHMGEYIAKRKKQVITGGVEQYAMPPTGTSPWPSMLRAQWHALVARLAHHVGVDPERLQLLLGVAPE